MRDTPYATELKTAEDGYGQKIERLYVKEAGREEIRFSWWKDGHMMVRPLDLPEDELLALLGAAVEKGVFRHEFLVGLHSVVAGHLNRVRYEKSIGRLRETDAERRATGNLLAVLDEIEPIDDEDWPEIEDQLPEPVQL